MEDHDHDYDYAEKYHRHNDLENELMSYIRGLREDLSALENRVSNLEGRS